MNKILAIYLFLLASLIGVELSLGAFVAPTIFYPASIFGEGVLSHFQSGQLMSAIFVKYNGLLMGFSIVSLVFEMVNFNNNKTQNFNIRFSTLMLSLLNLVLALMFVLYFTDYILEAQKMGEEITQNESFYKIHKASEWCMKILMTLQTILFFMKFPKKS